MRSQEELQVRIRETMQKKRIRAQDFKVMGVSRQGFYNVVNGKVSPQRVSAKMRQAFLILLGIDLLDYDFEPTRPVGNEDKND